MLCLGCPSHCLLLAFAFPVLCSEVLKAGSSKPWQEILFNLTGKEKMDAGALLEYFSPVTTWLQNQNNERNETLGWPDFEWRPPVPEGYPDGIGKSSALGPGVLGGVPRWTQHGIATQNTRGRWAMSLLERGEMG